jgi:hypothetical protein
VPFNAVTSVHTVATSHPELWVSKGRASRRPRLFILDFSGYSGLQLTFLIGRLWRKAAIRAGCRVDIFIRSNVPIAAPNKVVLGHEINAGPFPNRYFIGFLSFRRPQAKVAVVRCRNVTLICRSAQKNAITVTSHAERILTRIERESNGNIRLVIPARAPA